jgi:hypothetical protein
MCINLAHSLRHTGIAMGSGLEIGRKFYFNCVQRTDCERPPVSMNLRQTNQSTMPRYNCKGSITIYVPLETTVNGIACGTHLLECSINMPFTKGNEEPRFQIN